MPENDVSNLQALCHSCHAYKSKDFRTEMALAKKKGVIDDYKTSTVDAVNQPISDIIHKRPKKKLKRPQDNVSDEETTPIKQVSRKKIIHFQDSDSEEEIISTKKQPVKRVIRYQYDPNDQIVTDDKRLIKKVTYYQYDYDNQIITDKKLAVKKDT
uniref:HNH domain-containing protein n=1 Tax=viral metagenome TaxID=1070528 RepID=A0A6C0C729_9ZZZZ